jgi:phosphoribosylformimino-5-aminoimidazole carboxamide ribotide isomerase
MRIIPAIDIIEGKCVRLAKGDYATKKIYNENPLEVAKAFEAHGVKHLHLVDLDGAKSRHIVNHKILAKIATKTGLSIDFGGGLKTQEDLRIAFENGASQITGGSIAVKDERLFTEWIQEYGSRKIILGADAMDEKVAVSGWQEESKEALLPFIKKYLERGIKYVICTDISKDGMLQGPSIELYQRIILEMMEVKTKIADNGVAEVMAPSLHLIASGGIASFGDLPRLAEIGCEGAIIGKAIYENRISLKQLQQFIQDNES